MILFMETQICMAGSQTMSIAFINKINNFLNIWLSSNVKMDFFYA